MHGGLVIIGDLNAALSVTYQWVAACLGYQHLGLPSLELSVNGSRGAQPREPIFDSSDPGMAWVKRLDSLHSL